MKNKLQIVTIAIILLFSMFSGQVFGQQDIFNKLLPPEGQVFNTTVSITQDLNGTMWFSTTNGLHSYDGVQIKTYKQSVLNTNSLANNFTHSVCSDKNGMIWIAALGSGLDMLDPQTGNFTHYRHDPNDPTSLVSDSVFVVFIDKQGIYWIGTLGGLDRFDPETNTFFHYRSNANDTTSLSNNQVRVIYEDHQGTLWIGTGSPYINDGGGPEDGGLNKLNRDTDTFTRYMHNPNNNQSLVNNKVSAIFEDNKGTFWIGTWKNGIQKMDREQGTFEPAFTESELPELYRKHDFTSVGLTTGDYITFFTQDATGNLWFGTCVSGLYKFNPENNEVIFFNGTESSSSGFTAIGARSVFTSRDGILWFGTGNYQTSIFYLDPAIKKIQHTSFTGASVISFYEEPNGDFWIGTKREIIRIEKKNGTIKKFYTDDYNFNAPNNLRYMVNGDKEGNIWVGTAESLNLWDKKTEKFIAYKHDPENSKSISNSEPIVMYEDSKSNFWIGTASGLNLMDRKTGVFTRFYPVPEKASTVGSNIVTSILEDKSGKLWIGTWNSGGIYQFSIESKNFKNYLKGASLLALYEDADGVLWAGTLEGLYKYNPDIDNFIPFTTPGTVGNLPEVFSMVEDKNRNLWLTTHNQIIRINPARNEISAFGQNYGVGQNDFNYLSGYIKRDGEVYFGDTTGYFSFYPDELIENLKAPEIIFTALHLSDKNIKPGDGGPVQENLNTQKEIKLPYNQNVFSIDFTIADYANPAQNRLTYFLENFDIDWHNANSERKAYYFNIPPGKYVFRVKGVNGYGAWAEKKLEIIIMPPWYLTWLAYGIYLLLFIALIFGFDRFMRRRIIEIERRKSQERELAQAKEIEKAYKDLKATQAQLIQSEKMASLGELTAGIAHEIQNPLNFVNNFSEVNKELLEEMNEEIENGNLEEVKLLAKDVIDNEQKINYHGKRADAIVKGMLQHSRSSSGVKEPTDINALADEYLRLAYHGLRAKDKSFNATMNTEFDENIGKINVVPQDIGRVILNLISNAFYAVNEKKKEQIDGYEPTVSVGTKMSGSNLMISVEDNGNGIPQTALDKIFQPFFTTKPTGKGTGLGLSMSYEIITKAHNGELKVENKGDGGATFTIILPI